MSKIQKVLFIIAGAILLSVSLLILYTTSYTDEALIRLLIILCATIGGFILDVMLVQMVIESIAIYSFFETKLGLDSVITKVFTCPKCFGFWSGLIGSIIMCLIFWIEFPYFILYIAIMTWMCSTVNYIWYVIIDRLRYGKENSSDIQLNFEERIKEIQYATTASERKLGEGAPKKKGCNTCGN